jgi:hypothetical protein
MRYGRRHYSCGAMRCAYCALRALRHAALSDDQALRDGGNCCGAGCESTSVPALVQTVIKQSYLTSAMLTAPAA